MPRSFGGLWPKITDFDNIFRACREARRGKRFRDEVLAFTFRLEENIVTLQNELAWKIWRPGRWREFMVYDPKPRVIHAPAFRDRVVHHALCRVIEPLFERRFIYDSYACRRGKGTHAAMYRVRDFLRRLKRTCGRAYVLKADISRYFPSVAHEHLKDIIRRTIRCRDTLWLIDIIIDHGGDNGRGLPIGALTSQLFANVYLDIFDHFVKDELAVKFYVRYMDDFVILHPDKAYLRDVRDRIEDFLFERLSLRLNPKTRIFPHKQGVDFCGYRIWPTHVLPRKRNVKRARRRLGALARLYARGLVPLERVKTALASFLGYMKHCAGRTTTQCILKELVLVRPSGGSPWMLSPLAE